MFLLIVDEILHLDLAQVLPPEAQVFPVACEGPELERLPEGPVLAVLAAKGRKDALRARLGTLWPQGREVHELDPASPETFAPRLLSVLMAAGQQKDQRLGQILREKADMRQEAIHLNTRLREIEHLLQGIGNPQAMRVFEFQPQEGRVFLKKGATLTQALPLDVKSLLAVDLWLPELQLTQLGDLEVSVLSDEGEFAQLNATGAKWRDKSGWIRFWAAEPMQSFGQNAQLQLKWAGEGELCVALSLAMPDSRFAAKEAETVLDHTIALQVWKAAGRLAVPPAARHALPAVPLEGEQSFLLRASDLPPPKLLMKPPSMNDHAAVEFWKKEDAVFVHPSARGPVCGIIARVEVSALSYVTAQVMVGHELSNPLNFALGLRPSEEGDIYWQRHMGPWVTALPYGAWGQAIASLPSPYSGSVDILLTVSIANEAAADKAWGLFRSFRFVGADE